MTAQPEDFEERYGRFKLSVRPNGRYAVTLSTRHNGEVEVYGGNVASLYLPAVSKLAPFGRGEPVPYDYREDGLALSFDGDVGSFTVRGYTYRLTRDDAAAIARIIAAAISWHIQQATV